MSTTANTTDGVSDRAAFLRTILEWPVDLTPRLVFADWLDEQGDHERAAAIRRPRASATMILRLPGEVISAASRPEKAEVTYRYGFVDAIVLGSKAFMKHATQLFRIHPITAVFFTDVEPGTYWKRDDLYGWAFSRYPLPFYFDEMHVGIAKELKPHMPSGNQFDSPTAAVVGLSAACVAYGRTLAGLKPIDLDALLEWNRSTI